MQNYSSDEEISSIPEDEYQEYDRQDFEAIQFADTLHLIKIIMNFINFSVTNKIQLKLMMKMMMKMMKIKMKQMKKIQNKKNKNYKKMALNLDYLKEIKLKIRNLNQTQIIKEY